MAFYYVHALLLRDFCYNVIVSDFDNDGKYIISEEKHPLVFEVFHSFIGHKYEITVFGAVAVMSEWYKY